MGQQPLDTQLQYGVINGALISIEEIPLEKKGLRCGCICPSCGQPLVARLGKKRRRHFSHHQGTACNIEHANQTALHMLAKEIIEQERKFKFPGLSVSLSDIGWSNIYHLMYDTIPTSLEYRKATGALCSSVVLEKKVSDIVPDIIVETNGRMCLIEIAVTHFVDEEKQKRIDALGLPVVEVDLSSFVGGEITREIVRKALVEQDNNKKWLFNPLMPKAIEWARVEYEKRYKAALAQMGAEQRKRMKKEEERERKREETALLLEDLFVPENYKYELQLLRSDEKFQAVLKTLHLKKDINGDIPFFLDIPITGEMVFNCDRRIWQAAVFDIFIYNRNRGDIEIEQVQAFLRDHINYVPINWNLARRATILTNGIEQTFSLFYDVVKQYLDYLHYIGFIGQGRYGCASVRRTKSLDPPNKETAKELKSAIECLDEFAPDIDERIQEFLFPSWKCLSK